MIGAVRGVLGTEVDRDPRAHFRLGIAKAGGHDADDGPFDTVETYGALENVLGAAAVRQPQLVAHHGNRTGPFVPRSRTAPADGNSAKNWKDAGRDARHLDPLGERVGAASRRERHAPQAGCSDGIEGVLPPLVGAARGSRLP